MGSSKTCITPFTKQAFVTAGVSLNMSGSGLVLAFTTALLHQLKSPGSIIPIDDTSGSWIAAIPGISLVFGNCIAPPTMSRYGRRIANVVSIVPMIFSWAAIYFANSILILLLARFLQGICMGISTSLGPLLIGEYTSPKKRGLFLMTISVFVSFAVMAVHCLGSYLTWQTTALICGCVSCVDLFIVLFSPESPSWLAEKGRYDACKQSFRWLRGNTEESELRKMIQASIILKAAKAEIIQPQSCFKKFRNRIENCVITVKKKVFLKPIIIMIHIYILAQWSGLIVLVVYPIDLLHKVIGKDCNTPLLILSLDIHRIIANTTALYVIRKVKRRTILGVIVCINIFAVLATATYSYAKDIELVAADEFSLGISIVHLHMFTIATGSLPLSFIIAGEIFPLQYRSLASGISVLFHSTNMFITIKTVPLLLRTIDLYGLYILYASIMMYSLVVVWFLLPETKDRTLQNIEDEFRGRPLSAAELKSEQASRVFNAARRPSHPVVL